MIGTAAGTASSISFGHYVFEGQTLSSIVVLHTELQLLSERMLRSYYCAWSSAGLVGFRPDRRVGPAKPDYTHNASNWVERQQLLKHDQPSTCHRVLPPGIISQIVTVLTYSTSVVSQAPFELEEMKRMALAISTSCTQVRFLY